MPPRFSAIICTYQRYHVLDGAIQSLLAQSLTPGEMEIIIIDNSPDQRAAAEFGSQYSHIRHLQYVLEPVAGLSNARNVGVATARANIVGFIDDDAVADPGWADAILRAFADFGSKAGAVGGPVRPIWLSERPNWLADSLLIYLAIIDNGPTLHALPKGHIIVGCNMALDKQLITSLGGFSRQLGRIGSGLTLLSNEEPELFVRIRKAGRAIVHTPDAAVGHLIDPARLDQSWFRKRAAWQAVSDYIMAPAVTLALVPEAKVYLQAVENSQLRRRAIGFFGPVSDAEEFASEVNLIRQLTIATLSGGAEIDARAPERISTTIPARTLVTLALLRWMGRVRHALGVRP